MGGLTNLSDVRNHLYNRAELYWWISLALSLGIPLATFATIIFKIPEIQVTIGFIAVLSPFGVVWLREIAGDKSIKADRCRRSILYADGLGHDIAPEELLRIKACTLNGNIKAADFEKPYYDSRYDPGPKRLIDIVKQSAFFTSHLAEIVSGYLTRILIVLGIALIAIVYFGLPKLAGSQNLALIAKSATIIISTLYAGDILWLKLKYSDLHRESESTITQSAAMIQRQELTESEAFRLVEEYHLTINLNPPIPNYVYKKHAQRLNGIYRESTIPAGEQIG